MECLLVQASGQDCAVQYLRDASNVTALQEGHEQTAVQWNGCIGARISYVPLAHSDWSRLAN